jgi:hypothetical protein
MRDSVDATAHQTLKITPSAAFFDFVAHLPVNRGGHGRQ